MQEMHEMHETAEIKKALDHLPFKSWFLELV